MGEIKPTYDPRTPEIYFPNENKSLSELSRLFNSNINRKERRRQAKLLRKRMKKK